MRRFIPVLIVLFAACYLDKADLGEAPVDLTQAECDALGDPYADCPAFTPDATNCAGPSTGKKWNPNWTPGKPICLGFGKDITGCNCNRLDVPKADYNTCLNHRFVKCGEAGLLPGQTAATDMCFVTEPDKVKCEYLPTDDNGDPRWPETDEKDAPTTREMCELGVPDPADVKACRKKASCGAKGKKVGCTCMPCDVYALTADEEDVGAGSGTGSGSGDACIDDCEFEVESDPACAPEPVCTPTPTPSPTPSPSPTVTPTPSPTVTPTPSPTVTPTPWPTATPSL